MTKILQVLRHVNIGEGHISFAGSGRDRLNHPQNPTVRHLLCPLLRLLQCFIVIIDIIQPTAKPWTQHGRIYDGLSKIDFCGKRLYSKNHLHNRNSAISLLLLQVCLPGQANKETKVLFKFFRPGSLGSRVFNFEPLLKPTM